MKCEKISARTLLITELPEKHDGLSIPREVTIAINYVEQPNEGDRLRKAIALDGEIIPAIIRALNGEG